MNKLFDKIKNNNFVILLVIYIRFLLGGAFVFASPCKIFGLRFTSASGEFLNINTAWHLFETLYRSGIYWNFLGICQLLSGFLLLSQRYSKLGSIIYISIISNIFFITLSYDSFTITRYITFFMLLGNIVLIIWDWNTLKTIMNFPIKINDERKFRKFHKMYLWEIVGLILFCFLIFYRLIFNRYANQTDIIIVSCVSVLIIFFATIWALKRKRH